MATQRFTSVLIATTLALLLVISPMPSSTAAAQPVPCRDDVGAQSYAVDVEGEPATGHVSYPSATVAAGTAPLVVFAHGYGHTSFSWIEHMERVTDDLGAITVAMDYRGTTFDAAEYDREAETVPSSRGWRVREGALDLIAAAQDLSATCGSFAEVVLFSVSMGGNAAGLALAEQPKDPADDSPLFDHWFNLEGAVNVIETYHGARILAPANTFAANAQADIEEAFGGTFETATDTYTASAVVNRVEDIAGAGLHGVYMIHGVEDGLVPYNQAVEMATLLRDAGVPREFVTVVTKDDGEGGTTLTGYSGNDSSPLAGHASERSTSHVVMAGGFNRLEALLLDDVAVCGDADAVGGVSLRSGC